MFAAQLESLGKVINVEDLMTRCMGSMEFAERVLTVFQSRCESDLRELEEAIGAADLHRVERLAHRLKGACANAGAGQLGARASELGAAASAGEQEKIIACLIQLRHEWDECAAHLPGHQLAATS